MFYPTQVEAAQIVDLQKQGACINTIACMLRINKSRAIVVLKAKRFKPREKPIQDCEEWAFARAGNPRYD